VRWADRALIFTGVLMLLEVVKFLITGNAEPEDLLGAGNPVARAAWYPFYAGLLIALAARAPALMRNALAAWPLLALLALTAASQLWSIVPDVTSRRIVAVAFTVLFGIYLAVRPDRLDTLRTIGLALLAVIAVNLAVILSMPGTGIDQVLHIGAWKGITVEKNALGGDMARAAVLFMAVALADSKLRWLWLAGLAAAILMVLASTSRTAMIAAAMVIGLIVLWLIGRRSAVTALGVFYAAATVTGCAALFVILSPSEAAGLIGKDLTLTGRTGIWDVSLEKILEAPWTGYGLGAFWVAPYGPSYDVRSQVEWLVPSAHNSWLEIGLALGLPGMAILLIAVALPLIVSGVRMLQGTAPWLFAGLVQLVLFSVSESAIFWQPNTFSCAIFAFYATAALQPIQERATSWSRPRFKGFNRPALPPA
jgi:exopolysaccharide production protein ExoQ